MRRKRRKEKMNDLIKIEKNKIGDENINSVNARELWEFLESKQEFANWIKNRLLKTRYVEGTDFCSFDKFIKREKGSSVRKEYIISIDMAKNFAMQEQNNKGDEIRQYFIEIEKKYMQEIKPKFVIPDTYLKALKECVRLEELRIDNEKEIKVLEHNNQIKEKKLIKQQPKVEFAENVSNADTLLTISQFAKILGTGQIRFFKFLRKHKVLISKGDNYNIPYQDYIDKKYFRLIEKSTAKADGKIKIYVQTQITGKGQLYLQQLWVKYNDNNSLFA